MARAPRYDVHMDRRQTIGREAEDWAAAALQDAGLTIVARNVRLSGGEIDLVCRDGNVWVFVEVKARRAGWDGSPAAAVSWLKQRRIARLAQGYLKWRGLRDARCRFDVVEITLDGDRSALRHLRGAFDAPAG
jgi:putative endonuclease